MVRLHTVRNFCGLSLRTGCLVIGSVGLVFSTIFMALGALGSAMWNSELSRQPWCSGRNYNLKGTVCNDSLILDFVLKHIKLGTVILVTGISFVGIIVNSLLLAGTIRKDKSFYLTPWLIWFGLSIIIFFSISLLTFVIVITQDFESNASLIFGQIIATQVLAVVGGYCWLTVVSYRRELVVKKSPNGGNQEISPEI